MTALVERINPLTALGVALLVDLVLLASVDVVSAATAVLGELLLLPLSGVPPRRLARRSGVLLLAAGVAGVTITLYGRTAGVVHLHWGLVEVSDGSLQLALATALRILAIGLPAAVLLAGMDATRLADALGGRLHLPARFVLAGLAAVRLVEVFGEDWRTIALARRARGVGDGNRIRRAPSQVFALLVVALRRATLLATAMEARGLGAAERRTWSRPAPFGRADLGVLVAGLLVAALAVGVGLVTGSYRVLLT
ncbi:MAG TPA: energy-coupling factor transporter transmembrane component T [Amnibacterium sp.]|nr:energy-coupling factor transporter transmembrane component T [Amnibacterium sp.]